MSLMRRFLPVWIAFLLVSGVVSPTRGQQAFPIPPPDPEAGFEPIFDGKTLDGWEGDSTYWRVEEGALVGEVTLETLLEQNSFIIWRGGAVQDFELKVDYRVSAEGNSGINYRSTEVPDQPWALKGYQADIDGAGRWTGQLYEERGADVSRLARPVHRSQRERHARYPRFARGFYPTPVFRRKGGLERVSPYRAWQRAPSYHQRSRYEHDHR